MQIAIHAYLAGLKARRLTLLQFFIISSPIFLGVALGFLTSKGYWNFALVLAALVPLAVVFSAHPFIGVILWLLLMPLSSALPNPDLMYWALHRLLIPFTLCMTFLPHMVKNSRLPRYRFELPDLCIVLMAVYVPLSIILGPVDTRLTLIKYADRILIPFCMYLIVRLTPLSSRELRLLQWAVLFIAASQCAIGFLSLSAPQYLPYAWRPLLRGYAAGSLLNPNVFSCVLGFCICLLFQAAMERKPDFVRLVFIITCGVSVIAIFLSMERAAWLAGAVVLLGFFSLYPKIMLRFYLVAGVFMIALGGVFFSNFTGMASDRFSNKGTINDRIVVTDAMLQMIWAKPILGWGYTTLNNNLENYYRQVGAASARIGFATSHNTYLTIFTELGLVGFLLYLLPVIGLLVASLRAWRGMPRMESAYRRLLATFWLAVLQNIIVSNFMDMRFFPIGITLLWMNLGMIANLLDQHAEVRERYIANRPQHSRHQNRPLG